MAQPLRLRQVRLALAQGCFHLADLCLGPPGESAGTSRRVRWVELDGQRLPGDTLPLSDGLATHNVRVQLG
jgi:hypothetical protein